MIEMIVELDPVLESDQYWSMVVRCVTDIKLLDRFSQALPYRVEFNKDSAEATTVKEPPIFVDLIVEKIHSYGLEWNIVSEGMTAKIFVIGDASKVPGRSFLIGDLLLPRRVRETDKAAFKPRPLP